MRRCKALFTVGLVLSFWSMGLTNFSIPASAAYVSLSAGVKLPSGTPVILRLPSSINTATAKQGDVVSFEVARNVEIGGRVLIAQSAVATGEVSSVEKRDRRGRKDYGQSAKCASR